MRTQTNKIFFIWEEYFNTNVVQNCSCMVIIKSRLIYSHFYWHLKIIYFYCLHLGQIAPITFILYSLQFNVKDRLEIMVQFNMHCAKGIKKDYLYCNYRFTLSSFSTSATGIRTSLVCLQSFPCQPVLHTVRKVILLQHKFFIFCCLSLFISLLRKIKLHD